MTGMRIGSACTGYGGLDQAARAVFGGELTWYSEIEPAAVTLLEHHYPGVPNHGDLTSVDWTAAEPVDIFTAGWPCQPFSLAGKRKGAQDERAIWPHVARAVRALRPRYVALENVAAIAAAGELARAAGDLAALGYVGSWRSVRASDVGAPHRRERIFILATAADTCGERHGQRENRRVVGRVGRGEEGAALQRERSREVAGHRDDPAPADPARIGWGEGRPEPAGFGGGPDAALGGALAPADTQGEGREGPRPEPPRRGPERSGSSPAWGAYTPAIRRWERVTGRRAPAPTVLGRTGNPKLSPFFTEWLMGLSAGWITDVPGLSVNAQLKLCGNGVVPAQAEHALRLMLASAEGVAA